MTMTSTCSEKFIFSSLDRLQSVSSRMLYLIDVKEMNFFHTIQPVCSDLIEFSNIPENPWREESASHHRHRTVHERNRQSSILCWQTRWKTMVQNDSTPATVDGVLDQKPSKSPCKRNPPAIPFQLSSAQKKCSHHRSVLRKAIFRVD
jgi:hypothetical protein